jgi:hypothetical protein
MSLRVRVGDARSRAGEDCWSRLRGRFLYGQEGQSAEELHGLWSEGTQV